MTVKKKGPRGGLGGGWLVPMGRVEKASARRGRGDFVSQRRERVVQPAPGTRLDWTGKAPRPELMPGGRRGGVGQAAGRSVRGADGRAGFWAGKAPQHNLMPGGGGASIQPQYLGTKFNKGLFDRVDDYQPDLDDGSGNTSKLRLRRKQTDTYQIPLQVDIPRGFTDDDKGWEKLSKGRSGSWSKNLRNELDYEACLYSVFCKSKVIMQKYLDSRSYTLHVRHKVPYSHFMTAVEHAVYKNKISQLNNILVLSGRLCVERVNNIQGFISEYDNKYHKWVRLAANDPPNLFLGDGLNNSALGDNPDYHLTKDWLGQSKIPSGEKTPLSKHLASYKNYSKLISDGVLSHVEIQKALNSVHDHYDFLSILDEKYAGQIDVTPEVREILNLRAMMFQYPHKSWYKKLNLFYATDEVVDDVEG